MLIRLGFKEDGKKPYFGNALTNSSNLTRQITPPSSSHDGSSTFGSPSSSGTGPEKYARRRSLREWAIWDSNSAIKVRGKKKMMLMT